MIFEGQTSADTRGKTALKKKKKWPLCFGRQTDINPSALPGAR